MYVKTEEQTYKMKNNATDGVGSTSVWITCKACCKSFCGASDENTWAQEFARRGGKTARAMKDMQVCSSSMFSQISASPILQFAPLGFSADRTRSLSPSANPRETSLPPLTSSARTAHRRELQCSQLRAFNLKL